jgi:hypothetical protein
MSARPAQQATRLRSASCPAGTRSGGPRSLPTSSSDAPIFIGRFRGTFCLRGRTERGRPCWNWGGSRDAPRTAPRSISRPCY